MSFFAKKMILEIGSTKSNSAKKKYFEIIHKIKFSQNI